MYVGFEVLTAVIMKSSNCWDTKQCSLLKFNRRFGESCRLSTFNGLHGVISQKTELLIDMYVFMKSFYTQVVHQRVKLSH
jgi:hypothetical protein